MTLHIESSGSGPDIVFVHGWAWHGGIWDDVVERLANNYRVWVVDLPGHGRSREKDKFTFDSVYRAIAAKIPVATWIGWSLGGFVAIEAALRGVANRLVLVDTAPCFISAGDWSLGLSQQWFDEFSAGIAHDAERTLERFASLHLAGSGNERSLLRRLRTELTRFGLPDANALRAGLDLLQQTDVRSSLSKINVPTLVWHGANDQIASANAGDYLAQQIRSARLVRLDGAGHAALLSHADEFVNTLRMFLRE